MGGNPKMPPSESESAVLPPIASRVGERPTLDEEAAYGYYRVPRRYWDVSFEKIPDLPYRQKLESWHAKYLDHYRRDEPFPGLYLYGPLGSGKTAIAAGILKWAYRRAIPGLWVDFTTLADFRSKNEPWSDDVPEGLWDYAHRVDLLVVDDFLRGSRVNNFTAYQLSLLEALVRIRWSDGLTTIITSNASLEGIRDSELDSLVSVITEATYQIQVSGANYRGFMSTRKEPL